MSAPIDAGTLRACCAVLCEDCRTAPPSDCYRNLEREWWHRGSHMECDASDLRDELDRMGTILGALVMTYECPTCGALYADAKPVPCCEECDPERFS